MTTDPDGNIVEELGDFKVVYVFEQKKVKLIKGIQVLKSEAVEDLTISEFMEKVEQYKKLIES